MKQQLMEFSISATICRSIILGLSAFSSFSILADQQPTTPTRFAYVATYSPNGEGVYLMSVSAKDGSLFKDKVVSTAPNAAQLVLDTNGEYLYVASEVANFGDSGHGSLIAYSVNKQDGSLTKLNEIDSQGAGPVYLSIHPDGKYLLVANYISGSIASFPINRNGGLGRPASIKQSTGEPGAAQPKGAVEGSFAFGDRKGPHAHMIASDPSGKFVYSTDLGLNRIYQWKFNESTGVLSANNPPFIEASSPGAGPRHWVFHPSNHHLYLINEESSTLTSYRIDQDKGLLTQQQTLSSLPLNYKGTSFASGIILSADNRYLYVANRLHNSISQFAIDQSGDLMLIDNVWVHGDYTRSIVISPDGGSLYAMNQRSDHIVQFSIDKDSGKLTFTNRFTPVGSPSQMVFLPE
ncbi:lactonase family protein [Budvicia diplopodorum]|uniref:lactonase family protein n=1 Tax=Budvicia diplopodorum TaxID=1119056 RepID=UPI001FE51BA2|nr:lactonase family protein [Budvicia diplopodorum]